MVKRANGLGSIYFDKSKGRYAASFITPEGKRVVKRFKTTKEAENWLEDNRFNIRHNTFTEPNPIRTGQWVLQYLDTYKRNLRPRSMNLYLTAAEKLAPIADIPLQKLTSMDVQRLLNSLQKKISPGYVKKVYTVLNMAIKKAVALDLLQKNPLATVERPKNVTKKVQIFTIDELHRILDFTRENRRRLYVEVLTAAYTGLRIGELLSLQWSDITPGNISVTKTLTNDGRGGLWIQRTPKTSSSRRKVSIPPTLYKALMDWKEESRGAGLVFKTATGNFVVPSNERVAFETVQARLGIKPVRSFHALRHTHASQLLANGVPIAEVTKRLGHASPAITLGIYTTWIPGNDKKVALDVERIFK